MLSTFQSSEFAMQYTSQKPTIASVICHLWYNNVIKWYILPHLLLRINKTLNKKLESANQYALKTLLNTGNSVDYETTLSLANMHKYKVDWVNAWSQCTEILIPAIWAAGIVIPRTQQTGLAKLLCTGIRKINFSVLCLTDIGKILQNTASPAN